MIALNFYAEITKQAEQEAHLNKKTLWAPSANSC